MSAAWGRIRGICLPERCNVHAERQRVGEVGLATGFHFRDVTRRAPRIRVDAHGVVAVAPVLDFARRAGEPQQFVDAGAAEQRDLGQHLVLASQLLQGTQAACNLAECWALWSCA